MKKVFFILIALIICLLIYVNHGQEQVTNTFKPINYITIEAMGNINRPGQYRVPDNITKEELLALVGVKGDTIYQDFTIKDGLVINFGQVVANPIVIQTASKEELDSLPEIGDSRADKIIEYIAINGGFIDWVTFFNVVGIKNEQDQYNIMQQAVLR